MNDYMWTTEETERRYDDDAARTRMLEQMRRRITSIQVRERETSRLDEWQRQRQQQERDRMLRAEWPEPSELAKEKIGFLKDFIDGKMPKEKEDSILKPLPDELFEID